MWSIKWNGEKKSGDFGMESMQASVGGWRVMLCAVELSPHLLHHYHYQRFIIRNRIFIMLNFAQICKASWAHSAMNIPTLKKGHNTKQKDVLFSLGLKAVSHTGYWEQGRLWYSRFWSMKNKLDTHIRLERLAMALTHRYAIFLCR